MQVIINNEVKEIKITSVSTLADIVAQIGQDIQPGYIVTKATLNEKDLGHFWVENSKKTYVLDEDKLVLEIGDATKIATETLVNSKEQLEVLLNNFENIATSFRIHDEAHANAKFVQGIENLQFFLKVLEEASALLGRPLSQIIINEVAFTQYINELIETLDLVIKTQQQKDWVMLADIIEYELLPAIRKLDKIYSILEL
jgi:hypothetical protein